MWMDRPDKEGLWLFKGFRISNSKKFQTPLSTVVLISDSKEYKERVIYSIGHGAVYRLNQYQGVWKYVGDLLDE